MQKKRVYMRKLASVSKKDSGTYHRDPPAPHIGQITEIIGLAKIANHLLFLVIIRS